MSQHEINTSTSTDEPSRRSFTGWLMGLCSAGVGAVLAIPLVRLTLYPLTAPTSETTWSDAGPASDLASATTPLQRSGALQPVGGWRTTTSATSGSRTT